MRRATLVVQTFSLFYVRNLVSHIHDALRRHLDPDAALVICDEIDQAAHPEGVVFIIGEKFRPFRRRPGCRYVLLNLSVVTPLGNPFAASIRGHRQVLKKRRLLREKLPLVDMLLDYYPPQTRALRRRVGIPVMGFDAAVAPRSPVPMSERAYDVCFVGGMNPRRKAVLDRIEARGFVLSPHEGEPIEDIAARSRCCLNIHTERSNHLEVPRLVAALSTGCPVVTETSFGLASFGAGEFVDQRPLTALDDGVAAMLSDRDRLRRLGESCAAWYRETYLPRAEARWKDICDTLRQMEAPAPTRGPSQLAQRSTSGSSGLSSSSS